MGSSDASTGPWVKGWVVLLTGATTAGCGEAPPPPPTAVVEAQPESVCLHDDFTTQVRLDASLSSTGLSLTATPPPAEDTSLVYQWTFAGAAYRIEGRDESAREAWLVRSAGDRPLHVQLTVINQAGGEATTLFTLPITLPEPVRDCDGTTCSAGQHCADVAGRRICLPDLTCEDESPSCPACFQCDHASGRCLPREVVR